jgi:hypothetical protein
MAHDKAEQEQGFRPEDGDEPEPKTVAWHRLAAAGAGVAIGAAVALVALITILGQVG